MILPDVNLLLYAHNNLAPNHDRARAWWEEVMSAPQAVGLPWAVICGFVRLTTHRAVFDPPLTAARALDYVDSWLICQNVRILHPGPRHMQLLRGMFAAVGVAGRLTTDAHLAALAVEHNCTLHSNDSDFARFSGLRFVNPLA